VTRLAQLTLLAMVAGLVVACSPGGAPTPVGEGPLTADVAQNLLTRSDIESAGGDAGGLDRHVDDLLAVASDVDPTVASTTEALWNVRWIAEGRPGVLMTVTRFHDAASAHAALDKIEIGIAYEAMASAIGERSALSPANADIGVAITFISKRTLIALQLPVASDGATLLNEQQLLDLATALEAKLEASLHVTGA
jgi:hypothetical protein